MSETPAVTLFTTPSSSQHAAIDGSPLEGRANVTHISMENSTAWATYIKGVAGVQHTTWKDSTDFSAYDAALANSQALVVAPWTFPPPFTEERWRQAAKLRVIAGTFDNRFDGWLDVAEAHGRGIEVIDTSRSMSPTVAELAFAMTFNLLRNIPAAIQLVREGSWTEGPWDQPGFVYGDLSGRRVGLAGYGTINRRYAEMLSPFNCTVQAYDPFVPASKMRQAGIDPVESLTELASSSEIFVIGIPPTPATQEIISRKVIDALPRGAAVVVVTRMAVVEQEALWRRALSGELRVAVDVFDPEPPPADAPFRTSPYVLPTPHIASNADLYHRRCFTTASEDALSVLAGKHPKYGTSLRDDLIYRGVAGNLQQSNPVS